MKTYLTVIAILFAGSAIIADAADDAAAEALAKKSGCLNCHSVDKVKLGPALKAVAAKYKGKADGEAKLVTHLTTSPKMESTGQAHPSLKAKDDAEMKNLVQWILSR